MEDNKHIRMTLTLTLIAVIIGFMMAVQFQTVQEPVVRDTRDTWQLREDLVTEKELQLSLIREIKSNEEKLQKYETEMAQSKEQILTDTLNELKAEAGLTPVEGPGIIIKIEPVLEEILLGKTVNSVPPELIQRLVNELNQFGATEISIAEQRLINSSSIREINGKIKVDRYSLDRLPIEVKVTVKDMEMAQKLYNHMQVSKSAEDFFIDNFRLTISQPKEKVVIPAYQDSIQIRNLEVAETDKGG